MKDTFTLNSGLRPIRSLASEPFRLDHSDWNDLVDYLLRNRPLRGGKGVEGSKFLHPWQSFVKWAPEIGQFVVRTRPGFVRGHDVWSRTLLSMASTHTLERLGLTPDTRTPLPTSEKDQSDPSLNGATPTLGGANLDASGGLSGASLGGAEEPGKVTLEGGSSPGSEILDQDGVQTVEAPLTEYPWTPVSQETWRVVSGPDDANYQVRGNTDRPVPEIFYSRYNVRVAKIVTLDPLSPEAFTVEDAASNVPRKRARQLRCLEILLYQPRPRVELAITGDRDQFGDFAVEARYADPDEEPPRIVLSSRLPQEMVGAVRTTVDAAMRGEETFPYDICHLATVWLLGPSGDLTSFYPDNRWQALMEYHVHWNLDYTVNAEVYTIPPLYLTNPASPLTGGEVAQYIVDILTIEDERLQNLMNNGSVNGDFWTV